MRSAAPILAFCALGCLAASAPRWVDLEARYDATVWRREVEACEHESVLVQLRDQLRAATKKVSVLARFPCRTIDVPSPQSFTERLDLGIVRQPFDDTRRTGVPHSGWREVLGRLEGNGWRESSPAQPRGWDL